MAVKVSIVVPVYNVEKYLEECVDSLLNQTIDSKEIILVDDGSTDRSGKICDEYAATHDCIHVFHKTNRGLGSARNAGAAAAQGEYLYFIDSDDWLLPEALDELYTVCKQDQLDMILFGALPVYENDTVKKQFSQSDYTRRIDIRNVRSGLESLEIITRHNGEYQTSICMRMFRTDYYQGNHFLFQDHIVHEDEDIGFLTYLMASRVEILDKNYYMRRFRSGSIMASRKAVRSVEGLHYAWKRLMDYSQTADANSQKLIYQRCCTYTTICLEYYSSSDRESRPIIRAICQEMCSRQKKLYATKSTWLAGISPELFRVFSLVKHALLPH